MVGEMAEALPDCPNELESLLHQVRDRIRRHRDTADMRLASSIERRLAEKHGHTRAANANAERQLGSARQGRQRSL